MYFIAGLCVASMLASSLCVGIVRQYLRQHLIDVPNERSSHKVPTPRGGGLGFIIASIAGLMTYEIFAQSTFSISLWLSLLPLIIIGLLDDWKSLKATSRYAAQLLVSSLLVWQVGAFPQPWLMSSGLLGNILAIVITTIGITALINFYNFMDGLDGLLAGVSFIQLVFCAIAFNQLILLVPAAALVGFLFWNWSPAKIFMGDSGSTVLGAVVAMVLLQNANQVITVDSVNAWSSLVILLPLVGDAVYTLSRRLLQKENIFQAHRSHIYQRLNQSGWSHSQVSILYMSTTILSSASLLLWQNIGACFSLGMAIISIAIVESYLQQRTVGATAHSKEYTAASQTSS